MRNRISRIRKRASQLLLYLVQILDFLGRQRQSFLLVVFFQIVDMPDWLRLKVDGEHRLVQSVIHALQHRVVPGILRFDREELFYTQNAAEIHVLCNLDGIRTPRSYHLATRAYEEAVHAFTLYELGIAVKPAKFIDFILIQPVVCLGSNHALLRSPKKSIMPLYINMCICIPPAKLH